MLDPKIPIGFDVLLVRMNLSHLIILQVIAGSSTKSQLLIIESGLIERSQYKLLRVCIQQERIHIKILKWSFI